MRHFHEVELVALRRVAPRRAAYVFSGRRSSPHGVLALAGRATEALRYWAWPETQPAKAGTPCIERHGHAKQTHTDPQVGPTRITARRPNARRSARALRGSPVPCKP